MTSGAERVREPLWTRDFVLLITSAVFAYSMTFMLLPTLPIIAEDEAGAPAAIGGVIVAGYSVGCLLPRFLWGSLADSWGRRAVFQLGTGIMVVISAVFPIAAVAPAIIALRVIQGIGFSASTTGAGSIAADMVPASRRAEGIGFYSLANTLGMALGPALGLHLLQHVGSTGMYVTSAIGGLVSLALAALIRVRRQPTSNPELADSLAEVADIPSPAPAARNRGRFLERSALRTCLVFVFIVAPYGAVMGFIAAYGFARGVRDVGLYFSVFAAAVLLVRLGTGRLADRHGMTVVVLPAAAAMIVGLVILWWANGLLVFLISAVLVGVGYGALFPLLQANAYAVAPEDRRGAASATFYATADLGYAGGAAAVGVGIMLIGYPAAFASLALFVAVGTFFYFRVLRPSSP